MIRPERNHADRPAPPPSSPGRYDAGGPVGWMQDDLARRLAPGDAAPPAAAAHDRAVDGQAVDGQDAGRYATDGHGTGERAIRAASVAGGWAALLAGYAAALLLLCR